MHIGFALFCYFPFGGMQRDMIAVAHACSQRGHRVSILAHTWEGEYPEWAEVHLLQSRGLSNHARDRRFIEKMASVVPSLQLDCLVGFNKMPGLDVYYAADSCFASKLYEERGLWYRFTPRARFFIAMEKAVFGDSEPLTQILLISRAEQERYQHYYGTATERMQLLPPGIRRDRLMPADYLSRRRAVREQWLQAGEKMVLFVGSGFRTKGLDRAIKALASIPDIACRLLVIGDDENNAFLRLAIKLGVREKVQFLGGRNDVEQFLWAADLLIHPAYRENTGTVLLEAMVAGLPVLTTEPCGYAHYVERERMGAVLPDPFSQTNLDQSLRSLLMTEREQWWKRSKAFAEQADIYNLVEHAVRKIESCVEFGKQQAMTKAS